MHNPESTWFGTKPVTPGQKTAAVQGVFTSVADQYDVMNDLMSFGIHRVWKDRFVRLALRGKKVSPSAYAEGPRPREALGSSPRDQILKIIDVAGGTGDIAFRLHRACGGRADITVADLTPDMLRVGRARAIDRGILANLSLGLRDRAERGPRTSSGRGPQAARGPRVKPEGPGFRFQEANAEDLPFSDETFDLYTIAFGLRNVTRIDQGLNDAYRVLKPGGRFACLEFSRVQNKMLDQGYQFWSRLIPHIGAAVAHDRDSYQYLVESIRAFPSQSALAARIKGAGFDTVRVVNLTGGVAAIHIAEKY
jgi:demethylmenaquinone methyltransferase/2-methoxy-6-polyprenyl-1,4-benzoquinol methylase